MKKIILLTLIICAAFAGNAQTLPTYPGYTNINSGYQWLRGLFDALGAPAGGNAAFKTGQVQRAGALYYDSTGTDSGYYYYSGTQWRLIGSGGIDSTLASQGNQMSGDTVVFAGPFGTPGIFTNDRTLNTNRNIMHWTNGIPAATGGVNWQFSKQAYSPFQFISSDTVTTNSQGISINRPLSGIFARRILYFNTGTYRVPEEYGHYLGQTYMFTDTMNVRTDGGDFGQAVQAELRIKPLGTGGRQVVSTGHTTSLHTRRNEGVAALSSNFYMDGNGSQTLRLRGTGVGFSPYLIMFSGTTDTIDNFVYLQPSSFTGGGAKVMKSYVLAPTSATSQATEVDSAFFLFDTARREASYIAGSILTGVGDSTVTQAQFRVNGSALFNGWSGYWANVAANYTARSFTDKNYVDSAIAAAGGGTPDLQDVLNQDNNTTTSIFFNSGSSSIYSSTGGITFDHGGGNTSVLQSGSTANKFRWYPAAAVPYFNLDGSLLSTTRNIMFPDEDDTLATRSFARSVAAGGSGANTALSNLASVAINTDLVSDADNTDDLGTTSNAWKDAHLYSVKLKGATANTGTIAAEANAISFDGTVQSGTGAMSPIFWVTDTADLTLANSTAEQDVFKASQNEFTVQAGTTYRFWGTYYLEHGTTSHNTQMGFTPTTATVSRIKYYVISHGTASNSQVTTQTTNYINQTAVTVAAAAAANPAEAITFWGEFTIGATGGTIKPVIKFSADPTGTILVKAGTILYLQAMSNNTTISKGPFN